MSSRRTPGGRNSQQSKRELGSPDEQTDNKKGKTLKSPSVAESCVDEASPEAMITQPAQPCGLSSADLSAIVSQTTAAIETNIETVMQTKIEAMVRSIADLVIPEIVKGVTKSLEKRISAVERENEVLSKRVNQLEMSLDAAEQYSRRNCLRLSGFAESSGENTDDIVIEMGRAIGANVSLQEIDRSHRVGRKHNDRDGGNHKPRDIIVKFVSYRSRQSFYKKRGAAKDNGYRGKYVNEDLTRKRSSVLFKCRELKRDGRIQDAWSSDGKIVIKDRGGRVRPISSESDLTDYL